MPVKFEPATCKMEQEEKEICNDAWEHCVVLFYLF